MPTFREQENVQDRVLRYAEAIGWTVLPRKESDRERGFDLEVPPADRAKYGSLFSDEMLDAKVRELNPRYADAECAFLRQLQHLH